MHRVAAAGASTAGLCRDMHVTLHTSTTLFTHAHTHPPSLRPSWVLPQHLAISFASDATDICTTCAALTPPLSPPHRLPVRKGALRLWLPVYVHQTPPAAHAACELRFDLWRAHHTPRVWNQVGKASCSHILTC